MTQKPISDEARTLLSCPFCGGKWCSIRNTGNNGVLRQAYCRDVDCGARGPARPSEDHAIAAWNKREGIQAAIDEATWTECRTFTTLKEIGIPGDDLSSQISHIRHTLVSSRLQLSQCKELLREVIHYRRGIGKYNFSNLATSERSIAALEAWEELENKIEQFNQLKGK